MAHGLQRDAESAAKEAGQACIHPAYRASLLGKRKAYLEAIADINSLLAGNPLRKPRRARRKGRND